MTKMLIVVPVMGSLERTKPFWGLLQSACYNADLLVIDNLPDNNERVFWDKYVCDRWNKSANYRPQEDNLGLIRSLQYAYDEFADYDLYAFMHNDLYVYHEHWDGVIIDLYRDLSSQGHKPGLIGFFGAEGVGPGGGRLHVWSNMLEAEIHGWRFSPRLSNTGALVMSKQVAVLDGMIMIASRDMLKSRNGVDLSYDTHHFYDLDLSLESIDRGFSNWIIGIPVHHHSGQTACQPQFNDWANRYVGGSVELKGSEGQDILYHKNRDRFNRKWGGRLPWKVGSPW